MLARVVLSGELKIGYSWLPLARYLAMASPLCNPLSCSCLQHRVLHKQVSEVHPLPRLADLDSRDIE